MWLALVVAVASASPAWSRPVARPTRALHGVTAARQVTTAFVSPSLDDRDAAPLDWVARSSSRMPRERADAHSALSLQSARPTPEDIAPVTIARRKIPAHTDDGADPDCPPCLH